MSKIGKKKNCWKEKQMEKTQDRLSPNSVICSQSDCSCLLLQNDLDTLSQWGIRSDVFQPCKKCSYESRVSKILSFTTTPLTAPSLKKFKLLNIQVQQSLRTYHGLRMLIILRQRPYQLKLSSREILSHVQLNLNVTAFYYSGICQSCLVPSHKEGYRKVGTNAEAICQIYNWKIFTLQQCYQYVY